MAKALVSDELWELVEPLLPPEPRKPKEGRPRIPDWQVLTGILEDAFDRGLQNAGLTRSTDLAIGFPFYGDTLDELLNRLETPLIVDAVERGAPQDDSEAEFRGEFLLELAAGAALTDQQMDEFYSGSIRQRGVLNWEWVQSIAKALDKSGRFGEIVIDRFTREVYVYLLRSPRQALM
jgi:hypothetical protein